MKERTNSPSSSFTSVSPLDDMVVIQEEDANGAIRKVSIAAATAPNILCGRSLSYPDSVKGQDFRTDVVSVVVRFFCV